MKVQIFLFKDGAFIGDEVFDQAKISVGRSKRCDLRLEDPRVAEEHTVLDPQAIGPRDQVVVGPYVLKVRALAAAADAHAPAHVAEAMKDAAVEEEEIDLDELEADERPGFSLFDMLSGEDASGAQLRGDWALEIIGGQHDSVSTTELLRSGGDRFELRGKLRARLRSDGRAELDFSGDASGTLMVRDRELQLDDLKMAENLVPASVDHYRVRLERGARAVLRFGDAQYLVRFVRPPILASDRYRLVIDRLFAHAVGSSIAVHVLIALCLSVLSPRIKPSFAGPRDERTIPVEPPPPEVHIAETPLSAPAPGNTEKSAAKSKRLPAQRGGVLRAVLGRNLAGRSKLIEAAANVDAAPGGGDFHVGLPTMPAPDSGVQMSWGGGGKGHGGPLTGLPSREQLRGFHLARDGERAVRGKVATPSAGDVKKRDGVEYPRQAIAKVLDDHLGEIQACYERALVTNGALSGSITLEWTIDHAGRVQRPKQMTNTMHTPAVSSCIMRHLSRWTFPAPKRGEVIVSYPFRFESVEYR